MTKKKILISEFMDAPAVEALAREFDVTYDAGLVDRPADLAAAVPSADAVIVRNRTQVKGALLDACNNVKVVGRLGVGLDNIDIAACKSRGIEVIPATGANALAVAEYVIGTAMLLLRGTYLSSDVVAAGTWPRGPLSNGRETAGKTIGIIGFGGIGQLTCKLARALGMNVLAYDPLIPEGAAVWQANESKPAMLDELIAKSDVISLHVPLLDSTRNLMSAVRLATMKPNAVLINTARGGIVDEAALAAALKAGKLGGAALDVFDVEPLPAGNPFADCPNIILTPHIAGVTAESNERVSSMIAERVGAFLRR
jgi:(S)-sulfolactate dehydrogenase